MYCEKPPIGLKVQRLQRARHYAQNRDRPQGENMLRWAVIFLIVALVAAVFGFWGIVAAAAGVAKLLFFLFLVLFLISLVGGLVRRA
jgi:uncharacterized membrane protein YtjA (UPF0391 family)